MALILTWIRSVRNWLLQRILPYCRLIDGLTDWLTEWLVGRSVGRLIDWLIDWFIDRLIDWVSEWLRVTSSRTYKVISRRCLWICWAIFLLQTNAELRPCSKLHVPVPASSLCRASCSSISANIRIYVSVSTSNFSELNRDNSDTLSKIALHDCMQI